MFGIFKAHRSKYKSADSTTYGYEYITTVKNLIDFYDLIKTLEKNNFFEQKDGSVNDKNGKEIFHPSIPYLFNCSKYDYYADELSHLKPEKYQVDAAKVRAIRIKQSEKEKSPMES